MHGYVYMCTYTRRFTQLVSLGNTLSSDLAICILSTARKEAGRDYLSTAAQSQKMDDEAY